MEPSARCHGGEEPKPMLWLTSPAKACRAQSILVRSGNIGGQWPEHTLFLVHCSVLQLPL